MLRHCRVRTFPALRKLLDAEFRVRSRHKIGAKPNRVANDSSGTCLCNVVNLRKRRENKGLSPAASRLPPLSKSSSPPTSPLIPLPCHITTRRRREASTPLSHISPPREERGSVAPDPVHVHFFATSPQNPAPSGSPSAVSAAPSRPASSPAASLRRGTSN